MPFRALGNASLDNVGTAGGASSNSIKRTGSAAQLSTIAEHNGAETGTTNTPKKAKPSVHAAPSAAGKAGDAMDPAVHEGKAGGTVKGEELGGGVEQGAGADTVLQGEDEEEHLMLTSYEAGIAD